MKIRSFIISIAYIFMFGCVNSDEFLTEYFKKYPGLYNKKITMGWDMMKFYSDKPEESDSINKKVYIISVVDASCPNCYKGIKDWQNSILSDSNSDKIGIFIIAVGEKPEWAEKYIEEYEITIPIIEDTDVKFLSDNDLNKFGYLSYITDSDKKIKLIGNPYKNRILYPYFRKLFR